MVSISEFNLYWSWRMTLEDLVSTTTVLALGACGSGVRSRSYTRSWYFRKLRASQKLNIKLEIFRELELPKMQLSGVSGRSWKRANSGFSRHSPRLGCICNRTKARCEIITGPCLECYWGHISSHIQATSGIMRGFYMVFILFYIVLYVFIKF